MSLLLMFQMDPVFALLAIVVMIGLYQFLTYSRSRESDLAAIFQGVMTQATRYMHIRLQRRREQSGDEEWRPSVIMVDDRTFDRRSPLVFLRWLCHRHGFGTYLHFIKGHLNAASYVESQEVKRRLLSMAHRQRSTVYMDTIVSPSMTSALAQSLQVPGVSGLSNNTVMFEFSNSDPADVVTEVVDNCLFVASTRMTLLVLRHGDFYFGERQRIHIWLTWNDQENANLMILLGYILLGHPEWKDAEIRVFAALPDEEVTRRHDVFKRLMAKGRLPVSDKNIRFMSVDDVTDFRRLVGELSSEADLTVVGFDLEGLRDRREEVFCNHPTLKDVLFVHASQEIGIE